MLRKLKSRPRADSFENAPPKKRRYWDRTIYLLLVMAFFVALGNYLLGERLFLRADGIVLTDRSVIAATSLVRVSEIAVRPGQAVESGDVLLRAESIDVLGRLADLSMQEAALLEREAALRSQLGVAERILPAASDRLDSYQTRLDMITKTPQAKAVTAARRETVEDLVYDAQTEVATLEASVEGLAEEIGAVTAARDHARQAILEIQTYYADGVHISGVSGIVGDHVPAPGEVFRPGEPLVTLLYGAPYVLAYLPETYLFSIREGDAVTVANGQMRHEGWIEAILPVSQSIPEEFRTAFRLDESKQLARVRLSAGALFPVQSPVRISRPMTAVSALRQRYLAFMTSALPKLMASVN